MSGAGTRPDAAALAPVAFEKWEGLGNDFLLVRAPFAPDLAWIRAVCDRRRGVGADGVLVVQAGPELRMIVFNADGSRPEMCGNGLRCAAAHLAATRPGSGPAELEIATDAGPRRCVVRPLGPGGEPEDAFEVEVAMGKASFGEILTVEHGGRQVAFTAVDVGNPHAVFFEGSPEGNDAAGASLALDLDLLGPRVERIPPGGTNVEIARVDRAARRVDVDVWERGVGRTEACGTGACAVAAAACDRGLLPFDEDIAVRLPGGELTIRVARNDLALTMRGPARRAFVGRVRP